MNNIHHDTLVHYRTSSDIDIHDLAYIFNLNHGQLLKIEKGVIPPTFEIILLYHMLFAAPMEEIVPEKFAEIFSQCINRSNARIAFLTSGKHPKSDYRVKSIERIVKYLKTDYGC